MMLPAFLLMLIGLVLIAATMHAAPPSLRRLGRRRRAATVGGWGLLALSLPVALAGAAFGPGLLAWFGLLSVAGAAILLLATIMRRRA